MKDNNRNNNLEYFLESEKGGVYKLFKCDPLNYSNIGSIKQVLYKKSRLKKGTDKDFYYNLAVNLNKNNLGQSLQKIDSYIEKRKSKVIQIGASALKNNSDIRERLSKYFLIANNSYTSITIYLKDDIEYSEEKSNLEILKKMLSEANIKLKVSLIEKSNSFSNISESEKKYIRNFLKNY